MEPSGSRLRPARRGGCPSQLRCRLHAVSVDLRMSFSFDADKDQSNREKHGLPLSFGAKVVAGRKTEFLDKRWDYGEDRFVCFGLVGGRLYACVYTVRGDVTRLISVRKANDREVKRYG